MQIPLVLPRFLPLPSSLFSAARSAMSTLLCVEARASDLSRLSLIRCSLQIRNFIDEGNEVLAQTKMTEFKMTQAGKHHQVCVQFRRKDQIISAIEFEIVERKRGLKSQILQNLAAPKFRLAPVPEQRSVKLEELLEKYPVLENAPWIKETWPLEGILALALEEIGEGSGCDTQIEFQLFGAASSQIPCEIVGSENLGHRVIELTQGSELIAQIAVAQAFGFKYQENENTPL